MVTTSPDNLWSPDAAAQYKLTTDLAAMQDTVQSALSGGAVRNTRRIGTLAQRDALSAGEKPIGLIWEVPTTQTLYRWSGAAWDDVSVGTWSLTTPQQVSLANNSWTALAFPGGSVFTTGYNPVSAFNSGAVTVASSGLFEVHAQLTFAAGGSVATRAVGVTVNGGTDNVQGALDITNYLTNLSLFTTLRLNAGDVVRIRAYQGSGVALNVGDPGGGYKSVLRVRRLGT